MERASDAAYEAIKTWSQTARVAPGGLIDEADAGPTCLAKSEP
jgi:hypothetical protein